MFKLRAVQKNDIDDLFALSKLYTFINLPSDRELIEEKVTSSLKTFETPSKKLEDNHYIFVLEDLELGKVIGCSMIHAQHGTDEEPHFYLTVGQENKFSKSINTGFIHGTLKLGYDTDGPSEIGGLILNPSYRGNPNKLGKQLSFVRFLYMGMYPNEFKEQIHTELMPPFDSEGRSPLWEAIGRRFLNMEYHDADVLSRKNKEFILSLFPSGTIYETLLPIEARNAVGKVGKDTLPVKKMIESIGFKYTNEVDPFDGGPHYRCHLKELKPVKNMVKADIEFKDNDDLSWYIVDNTTDNFEAFCIQGKLDNNKLIVPKSFEKLFKDSTLTSKTIIPL
jgi:arginine N-succinyltransferase